MLAGPTSWVFNKVLDFLQCRKAEILILAGTVDDIAQLGQRHMRVRGRKDIEIDEREGFHHVGFGLLESVEEYCFAHAVGRKVINQQYLRARLEFPFEMSEPTKSFALPTHENQWFGKSVRDQGRKGNTR